MLRLAAAPPARPGHALGPPQSAPRTAHHPRGSTLPARASADADEPPANAREAIDAGIALLEAGDADGSLVLFTQALSLPGRGLKRFR